MFEEAFIDELTKIGVRMDIGGVQQRVAPQMRRVGQPDFLSRVPGRTLSNARTDALHAARREARIKAVEGAYARMRGQPSAVSHLPRFGQASGSTALAAPAKNPVVKQRDAVQASTGAVAGKEPYPFDAKTTPKAEPKAKGPGVFSRAREKMGKMWKHIEGGESMRSEERLDPTGKGYKFHATERPGARRPWSEDKVKAALPKRQSRNPLEGSGASAAIERSGSGFFRRIGGGVAAGARRTGAGVKNFFIEKDKDAKPAAASSGRKYPPAPTAEERKKKAAQAERWVPAGGSYQQPAGVKA